MNSLIIDDYPLLVLPGLAQKIGLNEAIFLQQLHFWIKKSGKEIDGRNWIYNTIDQWAAQFPFWSTRTIARIIKSLRDNDLILIDKLSEHKFDATNYYSVNYDKITAISATSIAPDCHNYILPDCHNLHPQTTTETNYKKNKQKKSDLVVTEIPPGLNLTAWERWIDYRKKISKSLKPASIATAQKKFAEFGDQQEAVVEQSIANGWTGLFSIKNQSGSAGGFFNKQAAIEAHNAEVARNWVPDEFKNKFDGEIYEHE